MGKKPDLSMVHECGCVVYVKRRVAGKLEPKAEDTRFVVLDDKAKGYRIYWPTKHRVTVERDVYFSKDAILNPENVQIEGEWGLPSNPNIPSNSNSSSNASPNIIQPEPTVEEP